MQDDEHNIWEYRTEEQDPEPNGALLLLIIVFCFALFVATAWKVFV
jgi:hypothetical protein